MALDDPLRALSWLFCWLGLVVMGLTLIRYPRRPLWCLLGPMFLILGVVGIVETKRVDRLDSGDGHHFNQGNAR